MKIYHLNQVLYLVQHERWLISAKFWQHTVCFHYTQQTEIQGPANILINLQWNDNMTTISTFMQHNHRQCDELYAAAEEAVANQEWAAANAGWLAFTSELNTHITDREEGQLFPALEAANGPAGPIAMMRMEHEQMRALVAQMNDALAAQEQQRFLGLGETLMMLTQQHNMKEENILYPIMDQIIAGEAENLQKS